MTFSFYCEMTFRKLICLRKYLDNYMSDLVETLALCIVGYYDILVFFREKDLRSSFEQFGPLKDVYLPKDYNTG